MKKIKLRRDYLKNQKGFTLVEVTIAAGLLSFEILAVIAMFTTSMKTNSFARRLTTSSYIAQDLLDTAKNTPYANLPTLAGTECFNHASSTADCGYVAPAGEDTVVIQNSVPIYTRLTTIKVDIPASGMTQVEAQVSWKDDSGNTHGTTLVSSISKY